MQKLQQKVTSRFLKEFLIKFVKNLLIILALSINYTCGFALTTILKMEAAYMLLITFFASFLAGIIIKNLGRGILYACISLVLSIFQIAIVFSAPLLLQGIILFASLDIVLRPIIFVVVISIIGIVVGGLIGNFFS